MGVAILISDRTDFRTRKITRYQEWHYIMIKRSILQEDITILNVYTTNKRASKYMRKKLTEPQRERDESTTRAGDFNTHLSEVDRSSRQKISKDIVELINSTK